MPNIAMFTVGTTVWVYFRQPVASRYGGTTTSVTGLYMARDEQFVYLGNGYQVTVAVPIDLISLIQV